MLLQGLTAQYLTLDSYIIRSGDVVVVHAASGGVGSLLVQMAKAKGGQVIGLTTSAAKKAMIMESGADAVFNLKEDWVQKISTYTKQAGTNAVYDSAGTTLL